tara:strand:+ start:896 stop:2722 length:1827 start_codon:yes stop_codon:yes gene_type:complete
MNIISQLINYDYIYPLAWEDPRVDNEVLNINNNDVILGITTGGDNILNYLVHSPKKIFTCDFNCHQNYLLDMKMSAIINLSQNDYYEMFFNKNTTIWYLNRLKLLDSLQIKGSKEFWINNGDDIFKSFIYSGTCKYAKYLTYFIPNQLLNLFNRHFINIEQQKEAYENIRPSILFITNFLDFILFTLGFVSLFGVPNEQVKTNSEFKCINFIDFICRNTMLNDNYFYSAYANEKLEKNNIPDYCKPENYEKVKDQLHKVKIYTSTLEDCMKSIQNNTVTKVSLLDHMDWMNDVTINNEMVQLERIVTSEHTIIYRSFSKYIPKKCLKKITNWSDDTHNTILNNKDRLGTYLSLHTIKFNKEEEFLSTISNSFCKQYNIYDEFKVLYSIYFNQMNNKLTSQQDRLDSFYKNQAEYYDTYRQHMLHGRESLIASIPFKYNSNWLDVGGGTGYSVNLVRNKIDSFNQIDIIEYSKSMHCVLAYNVSNYKNINTYCEDIHKYKSNIKYDIITFSYSLVMIPDLELTIKKVIDLLKPNGILAITDFYADNSLKGMFFKYIFSHDGVYLTDNIHNIVMRHNVDKILMKIDSGSFPYIPFLKCNYFTGIYKLKSA